MRLCVFTPDLDGIDERRDALVAQFATVCPEPIDAVCFAGYRKTGTQLDELGCYLPYEQHSPIKMKMARSVFRIVDHVPAVPASVARAGLAWSSSWLIELLLACDPDAIGLDIAWPSQLNDVLAPEFAGPVYAFDRGAVRKVGGTLQQQHADATAKVTIVLPTYNGSKYLRQSIQSCLDQTFRNLELIVADDGSAENIGAIVAEFTDSRVRYLRHEVNRGLPATLNTAFRAATGDYLTWTSDDNYYAPQAIERLVRFLQRYPRIDFVYSSQYILDELSPSNNLRVQIAQPPQHLVDTNGVGACFLYTRDVYREVGDYSTAAELVEDYDCWFRVTRKFRVHRIIYPLYYYRFHQNSLTFARDRQEHAKQTLLVKQQHSAV